MYLITKRVTAVALLEQSKTHDFAFIYKKHA